MPTTASRSSISRFQALATRETANTSTIALTSLTPASSAASLLLAILMMTLPAVNHVAGEWFVYIEAVGVLWFVLVLMRRLRRGEAGPGRQQATEVRADEVDLSS